MRRATAVLGAVLLTLSACGSNDSDSTTEQPASQATSEGSSSSTSKSDRDPCEDETLSQEDWIDAGCMDGDDPVAVDLPTIGDTEKVGTFEFTLKSGKDVGSTVKYIDSDNADAVTEGTFYVYSLKATNVGDGPAGVYGEIDFTLMDEEGREFDPIWAEGETSEGDQFYYDEINPEASVEGVVFFDLPKNAKPDMLVLLSEEEVDEDGALGSGVFEVKGK